MAWLQIDDTLREHRKIYALADALAIEDYAAVGIVVCLWTWALSNAEDGDLSRFPSRALSRACGWAGDASALLGALKHAGFVEADGKIHDWEQYAGRLLEKRAKNRDRMRAARESAEQDEESNAQGAQEARTTGAQEEAVQRTCSAQSAHKARTCSDCAGATVQYQNKKGIYDDDGDGDGARAGAREEADKDGGDGPDTELIAISEAHDAVHCAAQRAGFAQTAHDLDKADALMADYTPEWVLAAVSLAADGTQSQRCWRYVEGILKRWKLRGGIDTEPREPPPRQTARSGTKQDTSNPFVRALMDMEEAEHGA